MPMLCRILIPSGSVGMSYGTDVATDVTSGIASIIVNVVSFILSVTATALVPMLVSIGFPFRAEIMCMTESRLYNVTAGSTFLCCSFGCRSTGSMRLLAIGSSADLTLMPVSVLVAFPIC